MIALVAYCIAALIATFSVILLQAITMWPTFETRCPKIVIIPNACKNRLYDLIGVSAFDFLPVLFIVILLTCLPSFLLVKSLKRVQMDNPAAYGLAGLLIAAVGWLIFLYALNIWLPDDGEAPRDPFAFAMAYARQAKIFLPSGIVGGCTYWFVAHLLKRKVSRDVQID